MLHLNLSCGRAIGLVAAGSFLVAANESSHSKRLQLASIVDGEQAAVVLRGVW